MPKRIRKDLERFRRIVRGEVREQLRDLIESGEITGQRGRDRIKVPLKRVRLPEFRYDPNARGGVGSGRGEVGQPVAPGQDQDLSPQAGGGPGAHVPEVELALEELAEILGEALELPRIQPKGEREAEAGGEDYDDAATVGPATLLMKRQAFRRGLLRQLLMNGPTDPARDGVTVVTPVKDDLRYLHPSPRPEPEASVVIFFVRDASGSMTPDKTEIIRQENHWIDLWLRSHYRHVARVYVLHDYEAAEVGEDQFYTLSTGGGTRISSAYELCARVQANRYPFADWNVYHFHFSDGENWIGDSETACVPLLRDALLPNSNLFCYGQVALGRRAPGMHLEKLEAHLADDDRLLTSIIAGKEDILDSIRTFLGTGK